MNMTGGGGLASAAPGTNTVHIKGAKVPGSELADSLRGGNWPGSEKARYPLENSPRTDK